MNIKIESVQNDLSLNKRIGYWRIVDIALNTASTKDFHSAIMKDDRIRDNDFFIYICSNHVAIHEIIDNNTLEQRLLLITI